MRRADAFRILPVSAIAMILLVLVCNGSKLVPLVAAQESEALSPDKLFARVSGAVFVVVVADEQGKPIALGSAVAITPDELVTNKHVVGAGSRYLVRQGDRKWPAAVSAMSPEEDLCILNVEGLAVDVRLTIRPVNSLVIGERAYAIGAPEGFELTISDGLISGVRKEDFGSLLSG